MWELIPLPDSIAAFKFEGRRIRQRSWLRDAIEKEQPLCQLALCTPAGIVSFELSNGASIRINPKKNQFTPLVRGHIAEFIVISSSCLDPNVMYLFESTGNVRKSESPALPRNVPIDD